MWEAKQDHGTVGACGEPSEEDEKKKKKKAALFSGIFICAHAGSVASLQKGIFEENKMEIFG